MAAYILDESGLVIGTLDGTGHPANSTSTPPPADAKQPLQFVDGAWVKVTPAATNKHVTQLAFFSRFTPTERMQVRALQLRDYVVADFMMLTTAAKYIDLDMTDVQNGLAYLVSKQVLTVERAAEVLGAPIAASERP